MNAPLVRGRWMIEAGKLILSLAATDVVRHEPLAKIQELAQHASTFDDNGWYPRRIHADLLAALVASSLGEANARELLDRTGRVVALGSEDPFLRLALNLMTPELFVAALSRLWAMEHQMEDAFAIDACEPGRGHAAVRLVNVDGYDHVAPVAGGWVRALVAELGVPNVTVKESGWTLANSSPRDVRFELAWPVGEAPAESDEERQLKEHIVHGILTLAHAQRDGYSSAPVLLLRGPTSLKVIFAWVNEMLVSLAAEHEQGVVFRRQLGEKLVTVERQRAAIRELSTPIIEVWNGVLCLPVVGVIDTMRSVDMTTTLLRAVVEKDARYAIVDITGIEVMDTRTADHFVQMAKAVRLIGARYALAGVSPEIAQTVVRMGVDLHELTTYRNLREALQAGIQRV
jgi:rsbT co-antagonist protein RsbR